MAIRLGLRGCQAPKTKFRGKKEYSLHRTSPGFPSVAAELRLREHRGLPLADHRLLSKQLHAAAVAAAWAGEVCCFDLAEQARTLLQERNLEGNRVSSQVTSHVRQVAVS